MATFIVTTLTDELDNAAGTTVAEMGGVNDLSFREALELANRDANEDFITFSSALSGGTLRLGGTLGPLKVTGAVRIDADLNDDLRPDITITGDTLNNDVLQAGTSLTDVAGSLAKVVGGGNALTDNVRIFEVSGRGNDMLAVTGFTLTGGKANYGGAIGAKDFNTDFPKIEVYSSVISGNYATGDGGGLFAFAAEVYNSILQGNVAAGDGGAIAGAEAVLSRSAVVGNAATNGGGLATFGGHLDNSTVIGNTASNSGGALGIWTLVGGAGYELYSVTLTGNTANRAGGIDAPFIGNLENSLVLGNYAPTDPDIVTGINIAVYAGGNIVGSQLSINGTVDTTKTISVTDVFAVTKDYDPGPGTVLGGVAAANGGFVPSVALKADATNPAFDLSSIIATAIDLRVVTSTDLVGIGNSGPAGTGPIRDLGSYEFVDQEPTISAPPLFGSIAENTSTATAIKFATLSIVDADGNNTLSLSGADAALFEIQADGIYLKAGTILDFETNPVLDVTLNVATIGFGTISGSASFAVTDVDELPVLTGVAPSVTFGENTVNTTPQLIDASVTITDPEGNFNGGKLTVSGLLGEDSVAIRNQGTAASEIGVSGSNVTFGGTVIGTFAGGSGTTLTVTFNASATAAAIEALIENLTYANSSNTPTASRTLTLSVTDSGLRFIEATDAANPFNGINGAYTPALADVDGDGDLDLVASGTGSTLKYYQNTGSTAAPVYVALTGADNPLGGIDIGVAFNGPTPAFGDVDGDGDLDLVVGDSFGGLKYYKNTGSAIAPVYVALTGPKVRLQIFGCPSIPPPHWPTPMGTEISILWSESRLASSTISGIPGAPPHQPTLGCRSPAIHLSPLERTPTPPPRLAMSMATEISTSWSGILVASSITTETTGVPSRRATSSRPAPPIPSATSMWADSKRPYWSTWMATEISILLLGPIGARCKPSLMALVPTLSSPST